VRIGPAYLFEFFKDSLFCQTFSLPQNNFLNGLKYALFWKMIFSLNWHFQADKFYE